MGANNLGIGWTPERDVILRAAWDAGGSATKIASDMGGFEHTVDGGRNSVISRVHRLGLSKRKTGKKRLTPEERDRRRAANSELQNAKRSAKNAGHKFDEASLRAAEEALAAKPVAPAYEPTGILYSELKEFKCSEPNECRYIAPEDCGPVFYACGSPTLPGASYCGHHHGIVYHKPHQITDHEKARRGAQQAKNLGASVFRRPSNFVGEVRA